MNGWAETEQGLRPVRLSSTGHSLYVSFLDTQESFELTHPEILFFDKYASIGGYSLVKGSSPPNLRYDLLCFHIHFVKPRAA